MLFYLPIEPLEERYTEQWYRWFPQEFERQGISYRVIDGETLVDEVRVGTFLDMNSTLHYKAEQLKQVARLFHAGEVKSGDKFFVPDVEFWGIECLRYLAVLNGVEVGLYGFLHAGSYTKGDFMEPCSPFASRYETAWGDVFDLLFVGSSYHKDSYCSKRAVNPDKVVVTGNPYDLDEARSLMGQQAKVKRVIHSNRPDPEKRPDLTLDLFTSLKPLHPEWEFVLATSRRTWGTGDLRARACELRDRGVLVIHEGLSKREYLQLLAGSQVMTGNTIEENFGYCVLEALIADTIPVVPCDFSHPELLAGDGRCLFSTSEEQARKVTTAMVAPFSVTGYADRYRQSLPMIVSYLR